MHFYKVMQYYRKAACLSATDFAHVLLITLQLIILQVLPYHGKLQAPR